MVLVEVDGNFIDAEPMKNRSEGAMIKAYQALWARLTASGTVKPKTLGKRWQTTVGVMVDHVLYFPALIALVHVSLLENPAATSQNLTKLKRDT